MCQNMAVQMIFNSLNLFILWLLTGDFFLDSYDLFVRICIYLYVNVICLSISRAKFVIFLENFLF